MLLQRKKEYNAAYYQKNKARIVAEQRKYRANPHSKVKKKEYDAKRRQQRRMGSGKQPAHVGGG